MPSPANSSGVEQYRIQCGYHLAIVIIKTRYEDFIGNLKIAGPAHQSEGLMKYPVNG